MARFFPSLLVILLLDSVGHAEDDLTRKINEVIDAPEYKQVHWGLLAVNAKTGKTVYEKNSEQLFIPASVAKLFTCAAALAEFGPDYRFETPVYRRGNIKQGVLKGDLILVASGDLSFGGRNGKDGKLLFADNDHTYANSGGIGSCRIEGNPLFALEELAKQVAKAGIREVRGEVLIDDQLFPAARGTGSGPDLISPIVVNDNVLDVIVAPGKKPGEAATVEFFPKTDFYQMDAVVTTAEAGQDPRFLLQVVGPNQFTVRGEIAVDSKPLERIYPVVDPVLFARTLFIEQLRKQGIRVLAPLLRPTRIELIARDGGEKLTPVALFRSAPFGEVVRVTLKVSHNLYASSMPVLVAARYGKPTVEEGLLRQAKFLKQLDVPVDTLCLASGAGGASADSVSPLATVKLLQGMSRRPEWSAFMDGLPILGVDGTLAAGINPNSPAKGKVRGKTGTMIWNDPLNGRSLLRSKTLAGVMETAKGTPIFFALFANNIPLPADVTAMREGKTLGKLCEIIYEKGP